MKSKLFYPTNTCHISSDWFYKGMQVIIMENDFLRIAILADRGGDIFEFKYKPKNLDFMLRLPKGIQNPQKIFSQMRNTPNQLEDYYYGGWQEALPNSPTFTYRGASLGQHGEICLIPWKFSILENGPHKVSVKLWTRPLRVPILIEKTLTLKAGISTLFIDETITNQSGTHLDIMWGHHIAFGLPFLKEGGRIFTNAKKFTAEPNMPVQRRFKPEIEFDFPHVENIKDLKDDASTIPPENAPPYSDLAYLYGFDEEAFYAIKDEENDIGFALKWDSNVFKCLWYWQERYATQDAPWWGNTYAIALEPWTSRWSQDPNNAIANGEWLYLDAGESLSTKLEATGFEGDFDT